MTGSFLNEPEVSAQVQGLFDEDLAEDGFVSNASRLWAHQPGTLTQLFALMSDAFQPSGLSLRQRGILVTAAASTLGDPFLEPFRASPFRLREHARCAAMVHLPGPVALFCSGHSRNLPERDRDWTSLLARIWRQWRQLPLSC